MKAFNTTRVCRGCAVETRGCRVSTPSLHAAVIILLLLALASTSAQDRLAHGGSDRPHIMLGSGVDFFLVSSLREEYSASLGLFPTILPAPRFLSKGERLHRGSLAAVTIASRLDTTGQQELRWRGTLLDFTWSSRQIPIRWEWLREEESNPLIPHEPYRSDYHLLGGLLLDYDRTTPADLDIQWIQGQAGLGGEYGLAHGRSRLIWTGSVRAGGTTLRAGKGVLDELGPNTDETITGADLGADFSIGFKAWTRYMFAEIRGNASARTVIGGRSLATGALGLSLAWMLYTGGRTEATTGAQGLEGIIRFERRIYRFEGYEQAIEQLHVGVEYSFW